MAHKRLIQLDPEEVDGFVAYLAPRRHNGFGQRWMAMAQDATKILALSEDLGREDYRVFLYLTSVVDFENLLVINQSQIAREMGRQYQNINRSIKRLVKMGVLLEGPRIGVSRSYRFNPEFGWKGTAKNHVTALKDERQRRMKAAGITGVIAGGGAAQQPEAADKAEQPSSYNPHCGDFWPDLLKEVTA